MTEISDEEFNRLLNKTTEYLNEVEYPAEKADLIGAARSRDAPLDVLAVLEELPEKTYWTHDDLVALFVDTSEAAAGDPQEYGSTTSIFRGLRDLFRVTRL